MNDLMEKRDARTESIADRSITQIARLSSADRARCHGRHPASSYTSRQKDSSRAQAMIETNKPQSSTAPRERPGEIGRCSLLTVAIAPELRHIRYLRVMTRTCLSRWGLVALADTVETLIGEIAANAVQHTCADHVTLSVSYAHDVLRLEIEDGTPGRPKLRTPAPDDESGRGMLILNTLAAEWGTSEEGSTTWRTLDARGVGMEPAGSRTRP
ncbi:ATP-binding protein [Streptomyces sp. NPDC127074]|uniref:ATP-binding protein n=1 Tax=Streptomyces sp. NPDC127074 TaxID=3347130 RepID=UPI003652B9C0